MARNHHEIRSPRPNSQRVFFSDADYELYRDLLRKACARETVAVWGYCLMPNHVHLILTPATPEGLGRALGKAHRRYSAFVNARNRVTGHLFQGRFSSVVMDEEHLLAAARYAAMNPVRARLVERAEDRPWSSARAHLSGRNDRLVEVAPLLSRCGGRFAHLIGDEPAPSLAASLRAAETIGRPLGGPQFLDRLAALAGRDPRPLKRGRKPRRVD